MPFERYQPTRFGTRILSKANSGKGLNLTWVVIGDGVTGAPVDDITAVASEKLRVRISGVVPDGDTSIIYFRLCNDELENGFYYREIAVYAKDPDTDEEGAYLYARNRGECEFISDKLDTTNRIDAMIRVRVKFFRTEQITFVAGANPIYVLYDEYKSRTDALQATDERAGLTLMDHEARIAALENALYNDVTANSFVNRFDTIDYLHVTGIWNKPMQRVEC